MPKFKIDFCARAGTKQLNSVMSVMWSISGSLESVPSAKGVDFASLLQHLSGTNYQLSATLQNSCLTKTNSTLYTNTY